VAPTVRYTPGPWKTEFREEVNEVGESIGEKAYVRAGNGSGNDWWIAQLIDGVCEGTRDGNARLIAAAPELRDALRAIRRELVVLLPGVISKSTATAILHAEAAIKKATVRA
jgi:hypothetical protein